MKFEQYEQQLTAEELTAFEYQYDIALPKDFKEHYLQYNGGYPPYENVKGKQHLFTINSFYPIKYGVLPIEKIISDYEKSGIVFEDKILFAYDNGGNIYLISVAQNTYGYIYIVEAERAEDKAFVLVSESFTDFLNSFH